MTVACSTICSTATGLDEALEGIAAMGFREVDLMAFANWAHLVPAEMIDDPTKTAESVAELLDGHGLLAVAMNVGQSYPTNTAERTQRAQNLKELRAVAAFARHLSIPVLALQPGRKEAGGSFEKSFDLAVTAFQEISDAVVGSDLAVTFEPHSGSVAETYESMKALLEAVPALGVAYDPSHFVAMDLEVTQSAFLLPRTAHVHLRNAVKGNFQAPMDRGVLDFAWVVKQLRAHDYDGAIAIEYLDQREDMPAVGADIVRLRELLLSLTAG
jgi:sugar phosphate isomerase/epimerase